MKTPRSLVLGLLALNITLAPLSSANADSGSERNTRAETTPAPAVRVRAASGAIIEFRERNGRTRADGPSPVRDLPHLVLRRNGSLTEPEERSLVVELSEIRVPPPGVTVTLHVETQHDDPDPREAAETSSDSAPGSERRISVWREARWIPNPSRLPRLQAKTVFSRTFGAAVLSSNRSIPTPTDYFRYRVEVIDGRLPGAKGQPTSTMGTSASVSLSQDHAFLMENQWIAPLPQVQETSPGAAPDELIVYYTDMVPFRTGSRDPAAWLPRADVTGFVGSELVPQMVEAFRIQTEDWGFPWHPAWTSYRPGADAERLSVALSDGRTWFHGRSSRSANSGLSINVAAESNAFRGTLIDALMGSFHHELFHNLQRNIYQSLGGDGTVDGAKDAWQFFSEGTAVLASSVGRERAQFTSKAQVYMSKANGFVGYGGQFNDLNISYATMSPYHASIYWRFLYEQCGRIEDGALDAAAGMAVVRNALTLLYSGEVIDISASTALVRALPDIMDRALLTSPCPFDTYEESLVAFSRAVYALRLEGGRCEASGIPTGCGLYDPHLRYDAPPVDSVTHARAEEQLSGEIPSSFGVDFVEVALSEALDGHPLTLEVHGPTEDTTDITVQVWELKGAADEARPRPMPTPTPGPHILSGESLGGKLSYTIPVVDTAAFDRLGLIITRVDANEHLDPVGAYTIVLRWSQADPVLTAVSGL